MSERSHGAAVQEDAVGFTSLTPNRFSGAGVLLGAAGLFLVREALAGLLFGVTPMDVPALLAAAVVLLLAAGLACYLPARRASRLDPIKELK